MKIEYTKVGDYYLPNLDYPEEARPIGCWGMLRKEYLKAHKSGTYTVIFNISDSFLVFLHGIYKAVHSVIQIFMFKHPLQAGDRKSVV